MTDERDTSTLLARYAAGHAHPVNRLCHTIGIPLIALSVPMLVASPFTSGLWPISTTFFVVGWSFQLIGHVFERKPPEFLHDWRMLFVGLRWWFAKIRGEA